jgi:ABC-type uncharacterized transport system substrate-binding protein
MIVCRRELLAIFGGRAFAWPLTAGAQQPTMPLVGYLDSRSPETVANRLRGFRQGLKESGLVESENVGILYRFAENEPDRLQELATDLVRRGAAVIVTAGPTATFAAKAVTSTIPIVFLVGDDPVGRAPNRQGRRRPHGGCFSSKSTGHWFCRAPERGDRIPLRRESKRTIAGIGGRSG